MLLPLALLRCQVPRSLRSGSDDESVMNGSARLWWSRAPILTDQKNDSTPGELCMAHTLIVFNIASFLYTKRKFKVSSLVSWKTSIINIKVVVYDGTSQNQVRIYSCVWYDHSGVCLQLPMNSKSLWAVFIFHEERQKIFYKPWGLPDIVSRHSWTGSPLTDKQQKFPEEPRGTAAVCECVDESFVISDKNTISSLEHHKDTCSENMTCLFKKIYKLRLY